MKKVFFIIFIGFVAFSPVLKADFVNWDDGTLLTEEKLNPQGIKNIFSSHPINTFVPLTVFSFAVENAVFEQNPLAYHFDNLILHLMIVYLIFVLVTLLGFSSQVAFITSLLFCIHPMHVESVAWVTERKDVLYASLYLGSLIFYLKYIKSGKGTLYALSLGLAGLSILAKPMALSLPLILILIDWFIKRPLTKTSFFDKIPFFLAVIPVASVTFFYNHSLLTDVQSNSPLVWVWSLIFYIQKFLFPLYLTHSYAYPTEFTLMNREVVLSIVAGITILASLFVFRKNRVYLFCFGYFFLSIFFLLRFYDVWFDIVSDRFIYLPSLGFCLLFALLINKLPSKIILIAALVILAGSLSFKTYTQAKVWKENVSFWTNVYQYNPDSYMANYHLGIDLYTNKKYRQSLYFLNKSVAIKDDATTYKVIADAHYLLGEYYQSLDSVKYALEYYNDFSDDCLDGIYRVKAKSLSHLKKYEEADIAIKLALSIDPESKASLELKSSLDGKYKIVKNYKIYNEGRKLWEDGQFEKSLDNFSKLVKEDPTNNYYLWWRGMSNTGLQRYPEALADYKEALKNTEEKSTEADTLRDNIHQMEVKISEGIFFNQHQHQHQHQHQLAQGGLTQ